MTNKLQYPSILTVHLIWVLDVVFLLISDCVWLHRFKIHCVLRWCFCLAISNGGTVLKYRSIVTNDIWSQNWLHVLWVGSRRMVISLAA